LTNHNPLTHYNLAGSIFFSSAIVMIGETIKDIRANDAIKK